MEKIITIILSAGLVLAFCFLTTQKTFSQTVEGSHPSDTTIVAKNYDGKAVKGITSMRARSLIGVALGLLSLVVGLRARKRAAQGIGNKGANGAILSLCMGAISLALSIFHLCITAGAVFGSGSGKAGAIFALVLSLIGMFISGSLLRRKKV